MWLMIDRIMECIGFGLIVVFECKVVKELFVGFWVCFFMKL